MELTPEEKEAVRLKAEAAKDLSLNKEEAKKAIK